ncbi:MAG: hypothetical protein ACJ75Q_05775, partial [Gaiellaceae bacterium]
MLSTALLNPPLTVWRGNYHFGRSDSFFKRVVTFARQTADQEPEKRPPEADFFEELERLRAIAPVNGQGLLDQIELRWRHPKCSPALYALTCTLVAPPHQALIAESGELVQELACIKVGKAKRCVAARLPKYNVDPINRVLIAKGSPKLRVLLYGDG